MKDGVSETKAWVKCGGEQEEFVRKDKEVEELRKAMKKSTKVRSVANLLL